MSYRLFVTLGFATLNVVMLSVAMLNVVMPSVAMFNVAMPSVAFSNSNGECHFAECAHTAITYG